MWTRARIKQEARNSLRRFGYWMPLLVTFLTGILTGGFSTGTTTGSSVTTEYTTEYSGDLTPAGFITFLNDFFSELFGEVGMVLEDFFSNPLIALTTVFFIVIAFVIGLVCAFGWSAFVVGPVTVGKNRYFMEHRAFGSKFERLFWAFRSGRYLNVVKIMFWREVKIFLWSLLLFIPGIIKSYQYYMIPYILAENPGMDSERAFEISKEMTDGEKFDIFWLGLSFFGWILLGTLACGIGVLFVEPYIQATFAELYQVMRDKVHNSGFSDYSELPGFFPEQK